MRGKSSVSKSVASTASKAWGGQMGEVPPKGQGWASQCQQLHPLCPNFRSWIQNKTTAVVKPGQRSVRSPPEGSQDLSQGRPHQDSSGKVAQLHYDPLQIHILGICPSSRAGCLTALPMGGMQP